MDEKQEESVPITATRYDSVVAQCAVVERALQVNLAGLLDALPKGERYFFLPNPGNAGDSLIAVGAYQAFDRAGLTIEQIHPDQSGLHGKTVIFGGGGNLVPQYQDARRFIQAHHASARQLILLPHTIAGNEDLLKTLGENVTIFARERVSFDHLRNSGTGAQVFLDHDLALGVDMPSLMRERQPPFPCIAVRKVWAKARGGGVDRDIPSVKVALSSTLFEWSRRSASRSVGNFFRRDCEANADLVRREGDDISNVYMFGLRSKAIAYYGAARFVRYINRYARVRTDRLHVCIAAAVLGKQVDFFPNSYFKCRAVYEYSLRDRFPNVVWHGSLGKP